MLLVNRPYSRTSVRSSQNAPQRYHYTRATQLAPLSDSFYKTVDENNNEEINNSNNFHPMPLLHALPKIKNNKVALLPNKKENVQNRTLPTLKRTSLGPLQQETENHNALNKYKMNDFPDLGGNVVTTEGVKIAFSLPYLIAQRPPTPPPSGTRNEPLSGILLPAKRNYEDCASYEELPKLPSISDPSFNTIFSKMMQYCSNIFNFNDEKNAQAIDIKSKYLCETMEFIENIGESRNASLEIQSILFHMLEKNVFEQIPIYPNVLLSLNYKTMVIDPAWKHLFYCYQLLNRFVQLYPESEFINMKFIRKAIKLMSIPDNNERLQLLALVRTYYDLHVNDRSSILKEVGIILKEYNDKQLPPYPIANIIVLTGHIYMRNGKNLTPEIETFIKENIFPLINSEHVHIYIQHLQQLFSSIFIDERPIILDFFKYLKRTWYSTNANIMKVHIDILISIFPKFSEDNIKKNGKKVLSLLSEQLVSMNPSVVSAVLSLWLKPELDKWVSKNPKYCIMYMYDNVKRNSEQYWSQAIREKSQQTLSEMGKLDRNVFLKMRNEKGTYDLRRKRFESDNSAMKTWARIAKNVEHSDFDVKEKFKEIQNNFNFKAHEQQENSLFQNPAK